MIELPGTVTQLVEVGCAGQSSLHDLLGPETRLTIIEPLPQHYEATRRHYHDDPRVTVLNVAIWNEPGTVRLHDCGESAFVAGLPWGSTPVEVNDHYRRDGETVEVVARTFDELDTGDIDLLELDMEGAEWHAISRMTSRPRIVIVEMAWDRWRHPHESEIRDWMRQNRYGELCRFDANSVFWRQ